MQEIVTINDVARVAGVSKATVGRVVGNYGTVSEKSRQKVLAAIKELNYKPNTIAQGLRSHSTKTIAVLVGNITNNYCNALVYVIEKEAQKNGYNVIICNTREDAAREAEHLENMRSRNVDGIVLMSSQPDIRNIKEEYKNLYEGKFPIVFVDRRIQGLNGNVVMSNNVEISYEATSHLIKLGHKNIGVISTMGFSTIYERLEGYKKALEEHGLSYSGDLVYSTNNLDSNEAQMVTCRMLDEHPEITAIYILNNSLSTGVLLEMKKRNLRVREDLSLLVWDDEQLNQLFDLTTVEQSIDVIGKKACDLLFGMIQNNQTEPSVARVPANIIYRNSCKNITVDDRSAVSI